MALVRLRRAGRPGLRSPKADGRRRRHGRLRSGLDEEFLDRARIRHLGGVEVPVISAEDLVAMKVLAGRRKDLEDVRGVLAQQEGRIDLARTRDVLAAMEAVVGEGKLLARLERLVRAAYSGRKVRRTRRRRG